MRLPLVSDAAIIFAVPFGDTSSVEITHFTFKTMAVPFFYVAGCVNSCSVCE